MNFDELIAILERAKDESLVQINDSDPILDLVRINNEGVNHGVMKMFYKVLLEVYKARNMETDRRATA